MIKGFKEFLVKNNVLALAIAVIVGGAVGKVVSSLAADIIMPLISMTKTVRAWIQCHSRVGRRWRYAIRRGTGAGAAASMGSSMTAASFICRNDHSSHQPVRQPSLLQPRHDNSCDAWSCVSIAKRQSGAAHHRQRDRVVEQPPDLRDDALAVGADEPRRSRGYALWPLGFVAEH